MCYLCLKVRPQVFINFSHIDWLRYSVSALTLALANWKEVFAFSFLHHATHFRGRFLLWRWMESAPPTPAPLLLFNQMLLDQMQMDWTELEYRVEQHVSLGASRVPTVAQTGQTCFIYLYFKFVYLQPSCTSILNKRPLGKGYSEAVKKTLLYFKRKS